MCTASSIIRILFLFTWWLSSSAIVAQRHTIETQIGNKTITINAMDSISGTDVIACGTIKESGPYQNLGGLVCRISNGAILWSNWLTDSIHATPPVFGYSPYFDVKCTANNEIIVVGRGRASSSTTCAIARLDQWGNLLWNSTVSFPYETQQFTQVCLATDGSIYAVGYGRFMAHAAQIIARFTATGDTLWTRQLMNPGRRLRPIKAILQNDTLLVLGVEEDYDNTEKDMTLSRVTPDGDLIMHRKIGDAPFEYPTDMVPDGNGGVLISFSIGDSVGVVSVGRDFQPTLPFSLVTSATDHISLNRLLWDPVNAECTLLGSASDPFGEYASAMRFSTATNNVVWERTIPSLNSFKSLMLTSNPNELIAYSPPQLPNANGNYTAELARIHLLNGGDYTGSPCEPTMRISPEVTQSTISCREDSANLYSSWFAHVHHWVVKVPLSLSISTCSMTILPIQLVQWDAEPLMNAVRLTWTNASLSDHFEIERSADAQNWKKVGTVEGHHSGAIHHYAWTDVSPIVGTNYYRLQQIDPDGSSSYSPVLSAEPLRGAQFQVFPNPVGPGAALTVTDQVEVFNLNGERVGSGSKTFAAPDVPGVYVLRCNALSSLLFVQ